MKASPRVACARLDPEPCVVLLAALGALGSFASIGAVLDTALERRKLRKRERRARKRRFLERLVTLETTFRELDSSVRQLEMLLIDAPRATDGSDSDDTVVGALGSVRMSFGACRPLLSLSETKEFHRVVRRSQAAAVRATKVAAKVVEGAYVLSIGGLDKEVRLFTDVQVVLNQALHARSFEQGFELTYEAIRRARLASFRVRKRVKK